MSNALRKTKRHSYLDDSSKWTSEMRAPHFDVRSFQKRLDERVGVTREGKSILRLVWGPESIGLFGVPRYWVTRIKDGDKWIYTSVPRWMLESHLEKPQYAPSWKAMRHTMGEDDGFIATEPPDDFYMFRWLCAEHEPIDPLWQEPRCCRRAWEDDRRRCWGTYRAPNDYDLACVGKALQVREQGKFISAYEPLSPADLLLIESNSMKQMAEVAAKQHDERIAIGRDFDKRHKWRLSNTMPTTHNRFFDQGASNKIILTDS